MKKLIALWLLVTVLVPGKAVLASPNLKEMHRLMDKVQAGLPLEPTEKTILTDYLRSAIEEAKADVMKYMENHYRRAIEAGLLSQEDMDKGLNSLRILSAESRAVAQKFLVGILQGSLEAAEKAETGK